MKYSIDTSAILDAWRRYYPPDIMPNLWKNIENLIIKGDLIATEEVLEELSKKDDDVHNWAKDNSQMFIPHREEIQRTVTNILAQFPLLVKAFKGKSSADPFVIAVAIVEEAKVISGEKDNNNPKKPSIPYVCNELNIDCIPFLEFIREQGWSF